LEVISAGAAGVLTGGLQKIVATAASTSKSEETFLLGGVKIATSLGLSLLRNRGLAAKDIVLDLAGGCFRPLRHNNRGQTNNEAPAFAKATAWEAK
jgi:hypothetical protein